MPKTKCDWITEEIKLEHVDLVFTNFAGRETQTNPPGRRNFCVVLTDWELAERLLGDGWNVKRFKPREESEEGKTDYFLPVEISWRNSKFPCEIHMFTESGYLKIDESTVEMLDWAEIQNIDLIIGPYNWSNPVNCGVKAYLRHMYVTIKEDPLRAKYADQMKLDDEEPPFEPDAD
jgi:hypothetical protein